MILNVPSNKSCLHDVSPFKRNFVLGNSKTGATKRRKGVLFPDINPLISGEGIKGQREGNEGRERG